MSKNNNEQSISQVAQMDQSSEFKWKRYKEAEEAPRLSQFPSGYKYYYGYYLRDLYDHVSVPFRLRYYYIVYK